MSDRYHKDYSAIDDRLLNPQQAAKLWRLAPEDLRHGLMNMFYSVDERLHDEVLRLTAKSTDAPARATDRRAGAVTHARPAKTTDILQ